MSNLLSRQKLQDMIVKARDKCEAQVYQHMGQFTVIVYCQGDDLLLLLQPLSDICNLRAGWQALIAAWPYQLTSKPYPTKSNPPSLCAKFQPPFIMKRRPGPEKSSELVSVHLQISPEMLADLKRAASQDGISVNEVIRDGIGMWLRGQALYREE